MAAILASLRHPVVLAPLAGGATTPALVAAVGDAGGIGFIGAGYRTPDDLAAQIAAVRDLTPAPFGVNVFVPRRDPVEPGGARRLRRGAWPRRPPRWAWRWGRRGTRTTPGTPRSRC